MAVFTRKNMSAKASVDTVQLDIVNVRPDFTQYARTLAHMHTCTPTHVDTRTRARTHARPPARTHA